MKGSMQSNVMLHEIYQFNTANKQYQNFATDNNHIWGESHITEVAATKLTNSINIV